MENHKETISKYERVNRWLTLGANIGVVLGLAILVMQLRQNAELTRSTLEAQKNSFLSQIELSMTSPENLEAWVKSIRQPEAMTDKDIKIMDSYLLSIMLQWDQMLHMEKNGLISRHDAVNHFSNSASFIFGSTFAQKWYKLQGPGWENTMMAELADPIVLKVDHRFLEIYLDQLRMSSEEQNANN